jgi:hypothetical protein
VGEVVVVVVDVDEREGCEGARLTRYREVDRRGVELGCVGLRAGS